MKEDEKIRAKSKGFGYVKKETKKYTPKSKRDDANKEKVYSTPKTTEEIEAGKAIKHPEMTMATSHRKLWKKIKNGSR